MVVKDGDTLSLGTTTVRLYITPGHTPGTLSLIFPVFDKGTPLMAGLMGGTGGGQTPDSVRQQIASLQRWRGLANAAEVNVLVTNHPSHTSATEKQALLRYAMPGDTNPFTTGKARYQRYMQVMEECSRVQLARMGEKSD
jgi:metallo-beta-lactamase class B